MGKARLLVTMNDLVLKAQATVDAFLADRSAPHIDLVIKSPAERAAVHKEADRQGLLHASFDRAASETPSSSSSSSKSVRVLRLARDGEDGLKALIALRTAPGAAAVDAEREEEAREVTARRSNVGARQLQRQGLCLLHLRLAGSRGALGARTRVYLERGDGGALPATRIGAGDLVAMGEGGWTGVVARCGAERLEVVLDDARQDVGEAMEELERGGIRVDLVANDVTYKRMQHALNDVAAGKLAPRLAKVVFAGVPPAPREAKAGEEKARVWFQERMTESQREAIEFALASGDVACIHGPPGTGKTTTVAELVRHYVLDEGLRVLVCAPSNVAVDNLVEKIAEELPTMPRKVNAVRVGHPTRVSEAVLSNALDVRVERSSDRRSAVRDVRKRLLKVERSIKTCKLRSERRDLWAERRVLNQEVWDAQRDAVKDELDAADVVACTLAGAATRSLSGRTFDVVVIDEAAQALEPLCWIPMALAPRVVLAGDHKQLPPTVRSKEGAPVLETTLFDRLARAHGNMVLRMLTRQFRMHDCIAQWSSHEFYGDQLVSDESVAQHLLGDLERYNAAGAEDEVTAPFVFVDTAGCSGRGEEGGVEQSRSNALEADLVMHHLGRLLSHGLTGADVAVVTPYNAQVDLVKSRIEQAGWTGIEVGSVDGFQGREKEAIVISLVRSNDEHNVGFLEEDRRTNVAITRARRHVCVIADSATISSHPLLARLVDYCSEKGVYTGAYAYQGGAPETGGGRHGHFADDVAKVVVEEEPVVEEEKAEEVVVAAAEEVEEEAAPEPEPEEEEEELSDEESGEEIVLAGEGEATYPISVKHQKVEYALDVGRSCTLGTLRDYLSALTNIEATHVTLLAAKRMLHPRVNAELLWDVGVREDVQVMMMGTTKAERNILRGKKVKVSRKARERAQRERDRADVESGKAAEWLEDPHKRPGMTQGRQVPFKGSGKPPNKFKGKGKGRNRKR